MKIIHTNKWLTNVRWGLAIVIISTLCLIGWGTYLLMFNPYIFAPHLQTIHTK